MSVPKRQMNLTKWDTLLFETSQADVFVTFKGNSGLFVEIGDNEPDNEEESTTKCEGK